MAEINDLDIVDDNNTARFPEGQAAGTVNNAMRAHEGIIARDHEDQGARKSTTGSGTAYVFAAAQTLTALYDGLVLGFDANFTNTGSATLNVDSLGAKTIKKHNGKNLTAGDIEAGQKVRVIYDGVFFQMISPATTPQLTAVLDTNGNAINESEGSPVASAASPNIWVANGNTLHLTGSVNVTGFAAAPRAGAWRTLIIDAAPLFTDGANLIVEGDANFQAAAGDMAFVYAESTTQFRIWFKKADGTPVGPGGLPRSYLAGLKLSNGTDATNDIDIAVGEARSTADDSDLTVAAAIGKQIDVTFAAGGTPGAPTGGRSSTVALTNDTWYHIIAGLVSGTAEIGFDTSVTGANLVADHSFTNTRRIGSVRRGTATNLAFSQVGDDFLLDDPVRDVSVVNLGTTAVLFELTTPRDVQTIVRFNALIDDNGGGVAFVYLSSPDANDEAPSETAAPLGTFLMANSSNVRTGHGEIQVRTNTVSQIRARSNGTNDDLIIATLGWIDRRGRDD